MCTKTVYKKALLAVNTCNVSSNDVSHVEFRVQAQTPGFDKSNFHDPLKIDNKYFAFKPGKIMIYNGTDEEGKADRDIITVTNDTK